MVRLYPVWPAVPETVAPVHCEVRRVINVAVRGMQAARAALVRNITRAVDVGGVTVGIHEGAGVHPGSNNRPGTGETVAEVGAKNHFGTDKIPARPWLDVGLQQAQPDIQKIVRRHGADIPLEDVLHMIGTTSQQHIQQYIVDVNTPPNSPETIAMKGSSNPLIDTGLMRLSVTYELTPELPPEGLDIGA